MADFNVEVWSIRLPPSAQEAIKAYERHKASQSDRGTAE